MRKLRLQNILYPFALNDIRNWSPPVSTLRHNNTPGGGFGRLGGGKGQQIEKLSLKKDWIYGTDGTKLGFVNAQNENVNHIMYSERTTYSQSMASGSGNRER